MTTTAFPTTHNTEHSIDIAAEPADVLRIIVEAEHWPHIFDPTVHVEVEQLGTGRQRLHMWALGAGRVRAWTSLRTLHEAALSVTFRQERCAAPAASLGGEWLLQARRGGGTRVRLLHDFQAVDDDPDSVELISQAMERNSTAELAALREVAELGAAFGERVLSFCDAVTTDASPQAVYDFLYRADLWPQRLPHVARLELQEDTPGLQTMAMDTRSRDGAVHTTHSVRVCRPERREIAYKQTAMPAIMSAHTGRWIVVPTPAGTQVVSHHTVVLRPDLISEIFGGDISLEQARSRVREALGANSRTTLSLAAKAGQPGS